MSLYVLQNTNADIETVSANKWIKYTK